MRKKIIGILVATLMITTVFTGITYADSFQDEDEHDEANTYRRIRVHPDGQRLRGSRRWPTAQAVHGELRVVRK